MNILENCIGCPCTPEVPSEIAGFTSNQGGKRYFYSLGQQFGFWHRVAKQEFHPGPVYKRTPVVMTLGPSGLGINCAGSGEKA